jgi:hypothetical protein
MLVQVLFVLFVMFVLQALRPFPDSFEAPGGVRPRRAVHLLLYRRPSGITPDWFSVFRDHEP